MWLLTPQFVVGITHFDVCTEAAGCQYDAVLGVDNVLAALFVTADCLGLDADDASVLNDEFVGLGAQFDRHRKLLILDVCKESIDIAHTGLEILSAVGARPQSTDKLRGLVTPHKANLLELLHDVAGVLSERIDKRQIRLVVTGLPGLKCMEFRRVKKNGFFLVVIGLPLLGNLADQFFVQIGLGFFGQDAFDDLALTFGHLDMALVNIGRIKAAAAHARIAARKAVLFENNHFLSGFSSGHGSRQTGTARTDDDDIGVQRLGIRQQCRLRHFLFELSDIQSGLFQTLAGGVLDGKARERGTRNGVDFYALILDDVGNQFRLGQVSHRMRFGPIHNLDVSNCIVFNRDLHIDRAVAAHGTGGVDAVLGKCRHRCSHRSSQSSRYGQSREFRNHIASPFLTFFNGKLSTSRADSRQQIEFDAEPHQM